MFAIEDCGIPGLRLLRPRIVADARGRFVKLMHADFFAEQGLRSDFREQYYSVSTEAVIRGFHFQVPPMEHAKLVTCLAGRVMDVVVDIRRGSPWYGRHQVFDLSAESGSTLYIPAGCAHGFATLSASATLLYDVTSVYTPDCDTGIRWDSCGVAWPFAEPVLSPRDLGFRPLAEFVTPFEFADDTGALKHIR